MLIVISFNTGGSDYHEPSAISSVTAAPDLKCSYVVVIPAGESVGIGVVAIVNDDVHERRKEFYFDLSVSSTFRKRRIFVQNPRQSRVTVEIEDDDGQTACFAKFGYCLDS